MKLLQLFLRPKRPNNVWSRGFVVGRTRDGKAFRMSCIIDEYIRERMAARVARKMKAVDGVEALCEIFVPRKAGIVIANWWPRHNTACPYSSMGSRPPAPGAIVWPAFEPVAQMLTLN